MRYQIQYRCTFAYDGPVAESQNELRVCPVSDEHQTVLHASVHTQPSARVLTTRDYWGTRVDAFGVRAPHETLVVEVEADVTVTDPPRAEEAVPLSALSEQEFLDEHRELLGDSSMVTLTAPVARLAEQTAPDATDVVSLGTALCVAVEAAVEHETGVTEVGTSVEDVLAAGRGVCQDRAHLLVALCRARGLPARYVSGYLCAGPTGADTTTHAWVEIAVPGHGWHTLDPSDGDVDDQHRVVIGRGRDYADVPPVRGVYVGADAHTSTVAVEITQVAPVTGR